MIKDAIADAVPVLVLCGIILAFLIYASIKSQRGKPL